MTWATPKGSSRMSSHRRSLSWIVISVGVLALFLIFASSNLVSYPIGATVRRYFYGVDRPQNLDLSVSPIFDTTIDVQLNKSLDLIDKKVSPDLQSPTNSTGLSSDSSIESIDTKSDSQAPFGESTSPKFPKTEKVNGQVTSDAAASNLKTTVISSALSRPDSNGVMTSVTTMQGINEKILSLNFKDFKAEIKTADAQKSYKEGVTVLVTGCLTGKDNLRRQFAQSFFLAPQDKGYFVLNDVFRYLEESEPSEQHPVNEVGDATSVIITPDPEPCHISDPSAPDPANSHVNEDQDVAENAYKPSNHERQLLNEIEDVVEPQSLSNGNDVSQATELASSSAQEDTPKKSYASIVKVPKGSSEITKVHAPAKTLKAVPQKTENQSVESVELAAIPEPEAEPNSASIPEGSKNHEEVEGHSIYIRNLPLHVTVAQLEMEFKKFGPIKQGGIQVRNNKQQGYCFGFVEFQSLSSMNSAIQASPITIGGRQAVVEIKRTTTRVGSGSGTSITGRGRFPSGRGGFRNDNFRGRGVYSGGRGFVRNDYGNLGDFSARGRGPGGRGEVYQVYQQGRGRGGRSSGQKHIAVST